MASRREIQTGTRGLLKNGGNGRENGRGGGAEACSSRMKLNPARRAERLRRLLGRLEERRLPGELLVRMTHASFALEQMSESAEEVAKAVLGGADRRSLRPPQALRIRNHVAILRSIERMMRRKEELKVGAVIRWYTSVSCGLSTAAIDASRVGRLERQLERINSPQMRLPAAIGEVAGVHAELMADPIFPGFNGILARLLMQYHLARCGLPPVVLDGPSDRAKLAGAGGLEGRILELVVESYEWLMRWGDGEGRERMGAVGFEPTTKGL